MAVDILARGIAIGLEDKVNQLIGIDINKFATKDELADKLDKHNITDGLLVVYAANNGVQETIPITTTGQPQHLALLDETGNLHIADPTLPQHAVTKNYLDSQLVDLVQAAIAKIGQATTENLGMVKSSTGDNKVTVDTDGTMTVSTVNIMTLTQDEGDILILDSNI